jgi:hypothetical protein
VKNSDYGLTRTAADVNYQPHHAISSYSPGTAERSGYCKPTPAATVSAPVLPPMLGRVSA